MGDFTKAVDELIVDGSKIHKGSSELAVLISSRNCSPPIITTSFIALRVLTALAMKLMFATLLQPLRVREDTSEVPPEGLPLLTIEVPEEEEGGPRMHLAATTANPAVLRTAALKFAWSEEKNPREVR